ncbi:hypothetical protein LY78DRAFT_335472 [Colletotrichum sublineola]|nr:hypothetical protein LY78DRAFT_335472 [Colletotrichum sublineola]
MRALLFPRGRWLVSANQIRGGRTQCDSRVVMAPGVAAGRPRERMTAAFKRSREVQECAMQWAQRWQGEAVETIYEVCRGLLVRVLDKVKGSPGRQALVVYASEYASGTERREMERQDDEGWSLEVVFAQGGWAREMYGRAPGVGRQGRSARKTRQSIRTLMGVS